MSSRESRRREVTEQMQYFVEDCSWSVQRRLEKLGRRRLRVGYGKYSSWDEAERRRLRNSNSAGWWSSSARYNGAKPWKHFCKPECTKNTDEFLYWQALSERGVSHRIQYKTADSSSTPSEGAENAGPENAGPNVRGGKCTTGKCRNT